MYLKLEWLAEWKQWTKINLNKKEKLLYIEKVICISFAWIEKVLQMCKCILALKSDSRLEINKNYSKLG